MRALPPTRAPTAGLLCIHGTPDSDLVYLLHTVTRDGLRDASANEVAARLAALPAPMPQLLLCGHSHLPRDQWHVELRAVAYDHESAAQQAERNGRPDWADALRTGRVGRRERDQRCCQQADTSAQAKTIRAAPAAH